MSRNKKLIGVYTKDWWDLNFTVYGSMAQLWKRIWRIQGSREVKLLLWQACSNILPIELDNHARSSMHDLLCGSGDRWSCPMELPAARDVWMVCNSKIQKATSDEDAFCNILDKLLGCLDDVGVECVARHLWLRRNKVVFGEDLTRPTIVYQSAVDWLEAYMKATQDPFGRCDLTHWKFGKRRIQGR